MNHPEIMTATSAHSGVESLLATNKVIRNTYMLLSMTLAFSAVVAATSVALKLPHPGIILTLIGFFGLLFAVHKLKDSGWGIAAVFAWGVSRSVKRPLATLSEATARIAAGDLTRPLPASLNLETVALRVAQAKRGGLASTFNWVQFSVGDVSVTPLFKGDSFTESGPLELVLKTRPHAVWAKLAPLLSAYLLATLILLGAIVVWTRRSAQSLVDPLVALRDVAREIATSGDLSQP